MSLIHLTVVSSFIQRSNSLQMVGSRTLNKVEPAMTLKSNAPIQSHKVWNDVSRNFVHFLDLHNLRNKKRKKPCLKRISFVYIQQKHKLLN